MSKVRVMLTSNRVYLSRAAAGAALLLAATTLTACSSETVEDASTAYCDQVDTLTTELESLRTLVATDATVDELADQRSAVQDAFAATQEAADDLDEAVRSAADDANSSFRSSVGDIPTDVALSEAAGKYDQASEAYLSELASIATEAGCS